jgi:ABC-type transport system substrate-binding protein
MVIERVKAREGAIHRAALYTKYDPNGNYDITMVVPDDRLLEGRDVFRSLRPTATRGFFFSFANHLGKSLHFRRAIHFGFSPTEFVKGFPQLIPAFEMLPSYQWGRKGLRDRVDLERAKRELAKVAPHGLKQPIGCVVYGGSTFSRVDLENHERIQTQLARIGIQIDFVPSTEKFISEATATRYPLLLSGMISEHIDPLLMFGAFRSNSPYKYQKPIDGDPELDRLYESASRAMATEERLGAVQKLSAYLDEQVYFSPFSESFTRQTARKGLVKDWGKQTQSLLVFLDKIELSREGSK